MDYGLVHADTIRKTDGKELKGIVVEDYKDRVVFSTVDGEVTIPKSRIKELYLDSEEDNLIRLAERARDRGDYGTAYGYYTMITKIDPNSKRAKDGMTFLHGYLFRQGEIRKEEAIKKQEAIDRYGALIHTGISEIEAQRDAEKGLEKRLGITLVMSSGFPMIDSITKNMPAHQAGLRKGDLIISVWGRLTGYMKLKDVMALLLQKGAIEIKCVMERTVDVRIAERGFFAKPMNMIGADLGMEFDGLTVMNVADGAGAYKAGIEQGDFVTAINGQSTRYLPLKKSVKHIKRSKSGTVKLTIRREVVLWRNGGK